MSLKLSDTTNKNGILQVIERTLKFTDGYITGNATRLKEWVSEVNLALDWVYAIIFEQGGTWQFDDSNHTDYPIITTNIVANQRDYTFTTDEQGNLILDIYKVVVKSSSTGNYVEIKPVDQQSEEDMASFYNGANTTGIPTRYDKTANGIFLDCIPNYSATDGLKVFINREGSYFTTSDTTKKPGFAGLFHEILVLQPSYKYAYRNGLTNLNILKAETMEMEEKIKKHYGKRERDTKRRLTPNVVNNK